MNATNPSITSFGLELHDLFRMEDGWRIAAPSEWPRRRKELADILQSAFYGTLPPTPPRTACDVIQDIPVALLGDLRHIQAKVLPCPGSDFSFTLNLYLPPQSQARFPVLLSGDGCWHYITPDILRGIVRRGYALALFNRCEIVPNIPPADRSARFQRLHPGNTFGAVAAWAWGFHRVMDILPQFPEIDATRVAVSGHSRGGKASLLAGALDERIAIVSSNNSGSGGAGCWRFNGPKAEPLDAMLDNFPTWFAPSLEAYRGRQEQLPLDHHFVKALCAPRPLLSTEALDDLWANPAGTFLTHLAAREAYAFLGAREDAIGIHFRPGTHFYGADAVEALLDFCDLHFFGKPTATEFCKSPFGELPQAFAWRAPTKGG